MKTHQFIKNLLAGIGLMLSFTMAYAQQNLPNKQSKGLWVSVNKIKIDGKTTEWNNNFQAYNTATNLYYTMANNADFVYFIAHVQDPAVIKRITNNGFTFEIYKNEDSQNKDLISITVPYAANKYFSLNLSKPTQSDTSLDKGIMKSNNALLSKFHKFMVVKGIQGLDSVSVYNEAGIGLAEAFDINEDYTIELQLPVKFIKLLPGDIFKFSYHLVINGGPDLSHISRDIITMSNGRTNLIPAKDTTPEQQAAIDETVARINARNAPTNFRAEYTLAKE